MILWVKRIAALFALLCVMALFLPMGQMEVGIIAATVNLIWILAEKFPLAVQRFLPSWILVINTFLSAYGILSGGPETLAVLVGGGSLLAWNTNQFLRRWPDAPISVQYRYLRRLGGIVALGGGAGLSAVALQGTFSLSFPWVFLALLGGGVWGLRLISQGLTDTE